MTTRDYQKVDLDRLANALGDAAPRKRPGPFRVAIGVIALLAGAGAFDVTGVFLVALVVGVYFEAASVGFAVGRATVRWLTL